MTHPDGNSDDFTRSLKDLARHVDYRFDELQKQMTEIGFAVTPPPARVRPELPDATKSKIELDLFTQNACEITWALAAHVPFDKMGPNARLVVQDQITAVARAVSALEASTDPAEQDRVNSTDWSEARASIVVGIFANLGKVDLAQDIVEQAYPRPQAAAETVQALGAG